MRPDVSSPARILVVDDQEDNRAILRRRLGRAGYDVEEAADGLDALVRVAAARPDLILLDHMMPRLSGLETLERLRLSHTAAQLPVIMVTAHGDEDFVARCLDVGANDFVTKPIAFKVLRARVASQIERSRALTELARANEALERKVADRTINLERRTEELGEALAKAEAASLAKSQFLATMSHELRTPMNGVLGMTEVLAATSLSPSQKDQLRIIRSSGEALLSIINDVLDFSKIEAGKIRIDPQSFDLRETVDDVAALFAAAAARKHLELVVRYDPALPRHFVGDRGRIRQVLTNLMGNAVKFTDEGHVRISVSRGAAGESPDRFPLVIAVEDTGIGIPESHLESVFNAFEQVDATSTRRFGGTGLGLAITKRMTEAMGGGVELRSVLGEGSAFVVNLPLSVDAASEPEGTAVPAPTDARRALVADDLEVG